MYLDHKIMKYIFTQRDLNMRQRGWMEFLQDYDFTLHYHHGKANAMADELSRKSRGPLASISSRKMYQDLRRQYYWSGMKRHIQGFVRRCLTCQQVKAEHQKPVGLLQPLKVAEWKWEHVMMDFVTHLP